MKNIPTLHGSKTAYVLTWLAGIVAASAGQYVVGLLIVAYAAGHAA